MPILLTGCTGLAPLVDAEALATPTEIVAGCCSIEVEALPDWIIPVMEANPGFARRVAMMQFRPGQLTQTPEAMTLFIGALRPLDLVLVNSENRASGLMIAGHFSHAAIYLRT